ncbi:MAG: exodeoxyribonuclease VII large subunit [Patescibacteria group bacterium]
MNNDLLKKLKDWRIDEARREGVDLFRVLPNAALETIASLEPKTKKELMSIKGIKERKFNKYGLSILALVNGGSAVASNKNGTQIRMFASSDGVVESNAQEANGKNEKPYTISAYLNFLNMEFRKYEARVQGEVSSLDIRDGYLFFSLKDKNDGSVLSCFMWKNNYELCGIALEIGMEVIVGGFPEVYALTGRFNLKVSIIELVGEGALKKAYNELKQKLEKEGLFSAERKKPIPEFPRKIGLITSETGAVIHDFLNNLGKYGYRISFVNSRVEGQVAARSLLSAIKYFDGKDIDVLVIIRGGGSLESLQAFNNETLVRKIADFKIPVICGIGHDKDIPLVSLAVDRAVSTPTAVAVLLNKSWEKIANDISVIEKDLVYQYKEALDLTARRLELFSMNLARFFSNIFQVFEKLRHTVRNNLSKIAYEIKDKRKTLFLFSKSLLDGFKRGFENNGKILDDIEKQLQVFDPARQLKLGYSIVSVSGKVVKTVNQVKVGENLDIKISDGNLKSVVKDID